MSNQKIVATARLALSALGVLVAASGLFLFAGGAYLASLGGSWFFVAAGLGLTVAGVLIVRRRLAGAALYLLVFGAAVAWSLLDAGMAFWPLFSRLLVLAIVGWLLLLLLPAFDGQRARWPGYSAAAVVMLGLVGTLYAALQPRALIMVQDVPAPIPGRAVSAVPMGDWPYFGRTGSGTRHAPLDQITPANVGRLTVAWTYRTGEIPTGTQGHVVTPLHVDGMLYGCTQSSRLFALNADTGIAVWTFDPQSKENKVRPRCRGVGYHDAGQKAASSSDQAPASIGATPPAPACIRRIISSTVDARLVAVDAATGKPCEDFGDHGIVNLQAGMDNPNPEYYFPTAAPTVVRDLVIVGGMVWDNLKVGEPSGVVRAFDVRTGALVWAWDLGNPAITKLPPEGSTYTPGTPNVWSIPSFDEALGLVYLPTGNATPDMYGPGRSAADDRYSSSIVALDIATGRERWHFQTVHHDLWDYDVPSQPALYDVPDGHGGLIPALIQTTKRGQIFMLDRRNGKPIAQVQERAVPQGGLPGERLSPTQPYSVGMPAIGTEPLSEHRMWGLSLLDQMICRIEFRQARYEGEFTPPGERKTIEFPSWLGGFNWGSISIAENLGYMIVNDTRLAGITQLIPRAEYDKRQAPKKGDGGQAMAGTPWGVQLTQFLSPLGVPCQEPPYGTLSAIDLSTRKVMWQVPLGTTQDSGPLGIATHLPVPIGMPTRGGPLTTSSGLIFIGASQDLNMRAFDVRTGKQRWTARLPVGAEATPMTYVSPRTGRQFVVISAGGNSATTQKGDFVIAYALSR
jgi:quinate dehydrogenase (quinone)